MLLSLEESGLEPRDAISASEGIWVGFSSIMAEQCRRGGGVGCSVRGDEERSESLVSIPYLAW